MYLAEILCDNFYNSLDEEEFEKLKEAEPEEQLKFIKSAYKQHYGEEPSGALLYCLKNKVLFGEQLRN